MTLTCLEKFSLRPIPKTWLAMLAGLAFSLASAGASAVDLQSRSDIIDLMLCYAKGTDTFGVASNPNAFHDGLETYEACFTEDAVFNFWPPGTDFNAPAPIRIVGPYAWALFVDAPLDGTSLGQHMLTNFMVETEGKTGTLTAYLRATRASYNGFPASGASVVNVAVANGTYTLHVEKIRGKWMVKQLDLTLISFANHFTAP